jgi:hypothetical protein
MEPRLSDIAQRRKRRIQAPLSKSLTLKAFALPALVE